MGRLCGAQGLAARFPGRKPLAFSFSAAYRLHTGWPTQAPCLFCGTSAFLGSLFICFFSRGQGVPFCKRVCCALRRDGAAGAFFAAARLEEL